VQRYFIKNIGISLLKLQILFFRRTADQGIDTTVTGFPAPGKKLLLKKLSAGMSLNSASHCGFVQTIMVLDAKASMLYNEGTGPLFYFQLK
jgi:hypothetical protein